MAEKTHDQIGGDRIAKEDHDQRRRQRKRIAQQNSRIEQHADRNEEEDGECVAQGQRLLRRALRERRLAQDHAGEEGAERERDAEQLRRPIGDAECDREHREPEQFARTRMRNVVQDFGDDALTDDEHQRDEGKHLGKRNAHGAEDVVEGDGSRAAGVQHAGQSRN